MNAQLEEINSAIQNLSREFKAVKHRVANAEKRISDLEDDLVKENVLVKELSKQVSMLCHRVDDLESCSRRNNIRIIGLKRDLEVDDLTGLLNRIFHYVVGLSENDLPPEVDRAHQAPRPRPNPEDPPILLRWGDKQMILA